MRKAAVRLAAALALATALSSAPATAQPPAAAPPPMFIVHVEYARPSALADYEATTKEFVRQVQQHRDKIPGFSFNTLQGEDLSYAFISPVGGFDQVAAIYGGFASLAEAVGADDWTRFMERAGATYDHVDEWLFIELTDASYVPAKPRLTPEEERYVQLDFYRLEPGREVAAEAVARQWRATNERVGLADGYRIYKAILGGEMPLYVVSQAGRDPQDLAAAIERGRQAQGAAGQELTAKTLALTRAFESKRYWWRGDLSLPPVTSAPAR
jgi:hypothetical protein